MATEKNNQSCERITEVETRSIIESGVLIPFVVLMGIAFLIGSIFIREKK